MFKGIRQKVRKAQADMRAWGKTRANFGKSIWGIFRYYWNAPKSRVVVRTEIPFTEAVAAWGFGRGELAVRRARQSVGFICVFFFVIFVWCFFYFLKLLFFEGNFIASLACIIGAGTGIIVGTVNLWRWMVLRKRRYVPFFFWLKNGLRV